MNGRYWKLIEEVRAVDPTAAGKLYRMAKKPEMFKIDGFIDSGSLSGCFVWNSTIEGHEYWSNLDHIVKKRILSIIDRTYHPGD